jgi:hypothetical protein
MSCAFDSTINITTAREMDYRYSRTNDNALDFENPFRSNDVITRLLAGLLIAGMVFDVLGCVASLMQVLLLSGPYGREEFAMGAVRLGLANIGNLLLLLSTLPVFAVWIVRAHRNLPALGAQNLDVRPGWAVVWFFVPFANLWKPYQAMTTLWKASHDAPRWHVEDSPWWVAAWWVMWIVSTTANYTMSRVVENTDLENRLMVSVQLSAANEVCDLILKVLALLLVLRIWRAQKAQYEARGGAEAAFAAVNA